MNRTVSLMTLVLVIAAIPACVFAQTTPPECVGLPPSQWINLPYDSIGNWSGGGVVADPLASEGFADLIPESSQGWNTMYWTLASEAGSYHCFAHVRVDTNATSGNAFSLGLYDYSDATMLAQQNVMLQNAAYFGSGAVSDGQYHGYDLGEWYLKPNSAPFAANGTAFWFASANNPSVTAAYVDRIVLIAPTEPAECVGLPTSQWIDIQQEEIGNWSGGGAVADSAASDGFAQMIPESSVSWNTMYWTNASQAGSYHCYAHVRVATNATSGNAFSMGIWDYTTASSLVQQNIMLQNGASDGQYHVYDLGERYLKPNSAGLGTGTAFWFASANNPSVTAAYVDRIVLVGPTVPAECVGLPASQQWIDIQQEEIGNWSGGGAVADSAASDGFAQMIPESSVSWNTMYSTTASEAGSYHCYAHVRVATNATSGNAFSMGIWDYTIPGGLVQENIMLQNGASDGQYHIYDLGEWFLKPNSYQLSNNGTAFWFASANNPSVTAVYVDRIVLVGPTVPAECVGLPVNDWIDIQQEEIWSGGGTVPDSAASDGFARIIPESSAGWNTMYYTTASEAGTYHCYAHVRVAANATSGNAFTLGLWDYSENASIVQENVMLQNGASDGQYHIYDIGECVLKPNAATFANTGTAFWFASANNPSVSAVYVDRIVLAAPESINRITDLSGIPDKTDVILQSANVVTTAPGTFTDGTVYVEEANRIAGIRCVFNPSSLQPGIGDSVLLAGTTATDSAGKRYLTNVGAVGDSAGNPISALGAGVRSINRSNPNMYALLVRAWGKVTYVSPDSAFYYIDDGSATTDASGVATGLRVNLAGLATQVTSIPTVGQYVTKTGIFTKQVVQSGTSNVVVPTLQAINCTILVQEPQFTIYNLNTEAIVCEDPPYAAVVEMLGNNTDWNVEYTVPPGLRGAWHCYATVRCAATASSGPAFQLGIFDTTQDSLTYPISETIELENGASDNLYHTYDLGVQQLTTSDYFWFAPVDNYPAVTAVFVATITLTR